MGIEAIIEALLCAKCEQLRLDHGVQQTRAVLDLVGIVGTDQKVISVPVVEDIHPLEYLIDVVKIYVGQCACHCGSEG